MSKQRLLFNEIFKKPFYSDIKYNYEDEPNIVKYPEYWHWEKFIKENRIDLGFINPNIIHPHTWGAINLYGQSADSFMATTSTGTQLLLCLVAMEPSNPIYYRLYRRVRALLQVAYEIYVEELPSSIPVVSFFRNNGSPLIHPGNKLLSAHQILQRDCRILSIVSRDSKKNNRYNSAWEKEYIKVPFIKILKEDITKISTLRNLFKGKMFGFFDFEHTLTTETDENLLFKHLHLWSDHKTWGPGVDINGNVFLPNFNFRQFCLNTLNFKGKTVLIKPPINQPKEDTNVYKEVHANIIVEKECINKLFSIRNCKK